MLTNFRADRRVGARSRRRGPPLRDVLPTLQRWIRDGQRAAMATVVTVDRSAPREPGSVMAVSETGEVVGSVTGGCVEPAVYQQAEEVLGGAPARMATYGYADDEAFEVGLPCGGNVGIFVEPMVPELVEEVAAAVEAERPVAYLTTIGGEVDRQPAGDRRRGRPGRRGRGRRPSSAGAGRERGRDRRGRRRLRLLLRAPAGDVRVRGDRLRLGPVHRRQVPRLPRHRVRPAGDLRDARALPRRRRAGQRVATRVPGDRARWTRAPPSAS